MTFALCILTLLCGCSQPPAPPAPSAAPQALSAPPANSDLAGLKGSQVKQLQVTPFIADNGKDLAAILKGKLGETGAIVPLIDINKPDVFVVGVFPALTPEKVGPSQPIIVSGTLKPLEDAGAVKAVESKLGGKMLQQDGKYVYLVVEGDPWPAVAASPTPQGTP